MRVISTEELNSLLANLPSNPRIIASGNFATPHTLLAAANQSISAFRLHMLNVQPGIPRRLKITISWMTELPCKLVSLILFAFQEIKDCC